VSREVIGPRINADFTRIKKPIAILPKSWYYPIMSSKVFIVCLLFAAAAILPAQTAAEMLMILDSPAVTYSQAAMFVLTSAETTPPPDNIDFEIISTQNTFEIAVSLGWLPKNAGLNEPIKLRELSFLIMKAFDMKGGLMYAFFPGPRYAYRSMVSKSFIRGISDPDMTVSGEWFLRILGNVLNITEGDQ